jgi:hypothetical protein
LNLISRSNNFEIGIIQNQKELKDFKSENQTGNSFIRTKNADLAFNMMMKMCTKKGKRLNLIKNE